MKPCSIVFLKLMLFVVSASLTILSKAQGNFQKNLEKINEEIQKHPKNADNYIKRGQYFLGSGNWWASAKDYKKALELEPNNGAAAKGLADHVFWYLTNSIIKENLTGVLPDTSTFRSCLRYYAIALKSLPKKGESYNKVLYKQALIELAISDYTSCIEDFNLLANAGYRSVESKSLATWAQLLKGTSTEECLKTISEVVDQYPGINKLFIAQGVMALVYFKLGKLEEAKKGFEEYWVESGKYQKLLTDKNYLLNNSEAVIFEHPLDSKINKAIYLAQSDIAFSLKDYKGAAISLRLAKLEHERLFGKQPDANLEKKLADVQELIPKETPTKVKKPKQDSILKIAKRVALVIGVKNYVSVAPLQNTLNDAADMVTTLKGRGFEVILVLDPKNKQVLIEAIQKYYFMLQESKNGIGLLYYSGHGMQVDGSNYLIPTEASPKIKADINEQCLNMDYVMQAMEQAGNQLNIFILDACRNNPFRSFVRSGEQGLSMVAAPKGSYIVYATKPGSVASDGTDRNGLFTSKLLKYINTPNLNIEQVFKYVAADVSTDSNDSQRPWISSDYSGDFFFVQK